LNTGKTYILLRNSQEEDEETNNAFDFIFNLIGAN
jgi:hypothetical protein